MKTHALLPLACFALLHALPAIAQDAAPRPIDAGRLIILEGGTPIGYEDFAYEQRGDSLLVSATHTRALRGSDGTTSKWVKKFGLVADARDYGLRGYTSNLEFEGHVTIKGIVPGDTAMTVYSELDGHGDAHRLVQPPGRVYVMDPMLFTLFDVICRNVSAQPLDKRPIELVTLGDPPGTVRATATAAGPDTIRWAGRPMVARRWVLSDEQSSFLAWVSPQGQMLRLVPQGSNLEVLREEPKLPSRARPKPSPR